MQYSQDFGIITRESLKRVTNGQPSILLMKNPTVVSPAPARSLQMSTLCDRYLQRRSTPRLKVLWKNLWRGIVRWGKGQFWRNQPRVRQRLYHRPSTRSNKIPPKWTCWRTRKWKGMFQCFARANRCLHVEELYHPSNKDWKSLASLRIISFQNW